jgi:hypothetical protein
MDLPTEAALFDGVRQREWSLLIPSSFLVLAVRPMFAEASANVAF